MRTCLAQNWYKAAISAHLLKIAGVLCVTVLASTLSGCVDNIVLPTHQQLKAFEDAGPLLPETDIAQLLQYQQNTTRYKIVPGDLLTIHLPAYLVNTTIQPLNSSVYRHSVRVDEKGRVSIPIIGYIPAEGLSLKELEKSIVEACYPRYTQQPPTIVAQVEEFYSSQVSVTGAVKNPGTYELPTHKMTLVTALMAAGGIDQSKGATLIRIGQPQSELHGKLPLSGNSVIGSKHSSDLSGAALPTLTFSQADAHGTGTIHIKDGKHLLHAEELCLTDQQQRDMFSRRLRQAHPEWPVNYIASCLSQLAEILEPGSGCVENTFEQKDGWHANTRNLPSFGESETILLPVKGMNIPFSDVALKHGSSVIVEQIDPQIFTVIGLVRRPGAFPYPPQADYSLLDALGFAGGVDEVANPRYLRVYRRDKNDVVVDAAFEIKGTLPTSASAMRIKPGDVIAVEQTPRTRANVLLSQVLRFQFGAMTYYRLDGFSE